MRQYGRRGPNALDRPIKMRPSGGRRANSSCLKSRSRRAYNRSAMGIAQARLVNYYAEATPFAPDARFPARA